MDDKKSSYKNNLKYTNVINATSMGALKNADIIRFAFVNFVNI
jgi:hypothetical protein